MAARLLCNAEKVMRRNVCLLALTSGLFLRSMSGCAGEATEQETQAQRLAAGWGSDDGWGSDEGSWGSEDSKSSTSSGRGNPSPGKGGGLPKFSFFVTSLRAMRDLSRSQSGFGGDLRFGETGDNPGLRGADKICATIAEESMPGSGSKVWRAFLSTTKGGAGGGPVHAKDRIGSGPWYDRVGRLVAMSQTDLMQYRPGKADSEIKDDLPNEDGIPNHDPDGDGPVDNHNTLTGTRTDGRLYSSDPAFTCNDWTSSKRSGSPRVGHSWLRGGSSVIRSLGGLSNADGSYGDWKSYTNTGGCGAAVTLGESSGSEPVDREPVVGSRGGYGGIYCFALQP